MILGVFYIAIGNSDDKLTQQEWARYWNRVNAAIMRWNPVTHGVWLSAPNYGFQNACWCIEVTSDFMKNQLQEALRCLAGEFRQDSIAWTEAANVDFLTPLTLADGYAPYPQVGE